MAAANSIAGQAVDPVRDPALHRAWSAAVAGAPVTGIAGAAAGSHGSVVVVSPAPVDDAAVADAAPELAAALGVRSVEVVVVSSTTLPDLIRDWIHQAAQGSGRGVHLTVRAGGDGDTAPVRVLVRAIDSSARELAFRLASPQEPALAALRALLGGREISVEDEESLPGS
jgi:hypothetical protein